MQRTKKAKVAIIGLGNIGKILATNLTNGNREVIIADTLLDKATDLADELGDLAIPMKVEDAIKQADLVVLAIHFPSIKQFLSEHGGALNGKTIIDPSNPIVPDDKGGFMKMIGESESSGNILSTLLPPGARLVKALGTLGAASLAIVAHQKPAFVQFYAIDDLLFNSEIEDLIRDNGFEPLCIGGVDQSIRIEVFGDLNEFGAIGKPVYLDEARSKL